MRVYYATGEDPSQFLLVAKYKLLLQLDKQIIRQDKEIKDRWDTYLSIGHDFFDFLYDQSAYLNANCFTDSEPKLLYGNPVSFNEHIPLNPGSYFSTIQLLNSGFLANLLKAISQEGIAFIEQALFSLANLLAHRKRLIREINRLLRMKFHQLANQVIGTKREGFGKYSTWPRPSPSFAS